MTGLYGVDSWYIRSSIGAGIFLSYLEPRARQISRAMPKKRNSTYPLVQLAGGMDRDASISPKGSRLLGTEPRNDGKSARRTVVFGRHDLPSAGAALGRPFSPQIRI